MREKETPMPSEGITRAALAAIGLLILSACQTPTVGESQVEMTWSEHNTMYGVLNDVRKEARKQRVETGVLEVNEVADMLARRDPEVRDILSDSQWQAYDERERYYYVGKIVLSVWQSPLGFVSQGRHAGAGNFGANHTTNAILGGPGVN